MRFMTVTDKPPRLEIGFLIRDSRSVDLDIALHVMAMEHQWKIRESARDMSKTNYVVLDSDDVFLGGAYFTHGFEPPTRAVFENRPLGEDYQPALRASVIAISIAFLEECASRGLISEAQRDKAVADLKRHDKVEV